jgi:quinol monooxygenase YgiN
MTSPYVSWLLELKIGPGKLEEFCSVARDLIAQTQNEPGTLDYEWSLSADGTTAHIFERYANSEALVLHVTQGFAQHADRFMAACTPTHMTVYGKPTDEAKAAIGDLGPAYFEPLGGFSR